MKNVNSRRGRKVNLKFMRSIVFKLTLSLGIYVLFLLIIYLSTLYITNLQKADALVINLAGRQRMLTQKMTKELLIYERTKDEKMKESLLNTMRVFDTTLKALKDGGEAPFDLNWTKMVKIPHAPDTVYPQLEKVKKMWDEFKSRMNGFLETKSEEDIEYIFNNNLTLLSEMNKAVSLFQDHAEKKVSLMKFTQLLFLLVGVGITVILVFFYRKSILKPLNEMLEVVEELAKGGGDLRVKIPVRTKDEIGKLADAFNRYMDSLRKFFLNMRTGFKDEVVNTAKVEKNTSRFMDVFEEIAKSIERSITQVENVAESIGELNASAGEIADTSQNLAKMAEELNHVSSEIAGGAEEGKNAMEIVQQSLNSIRNRMSKLSDDAKELSKKAVFINEVVDTITNITEQTNLLALNAAIEAARAGESGRGFAVVADEIRKLAEESKNATVRISETLKEIMDGVESTSNEMLKISDEIFEMSKRNEEATSKIYDILSRVENLNNMASNVAASAQEQGASIEEMSASTQNISGLSSDLEKMMKRILDRVDKSRENAEKVMENLKKMVDFTGSMVERLSQLRVLTNEDFISEIDSAIQSHERWFQDLGKVFEDEEVDVILDHRMCEFGTFYLSVQPPQGFEDEWKEIGELHVGMHENGKKILNLLKEGEEEDARKLYSELAEKKSKLVALLNEVKEGLRKGE